MTQWSPQQDSALKAVDNWYKNHRHAKQTFYLAGWAGTGKTTLAKHFAEGIDGTVKFATFTGKAAHVMASKGCSGASTVHKLIYRPKIASKNHLKLLEKQLADHEAMAEPDFEVTARIRQEIKEEQKNAGRMAFSLNLESELRHSKLLILDECSMISMEMGRDLESFGVPILVLGDPEQLPPIYGAGYFTEKTPDFQLTEIHRQARDNPIIELSRIVREGGSLALGSYGTSRVISEKLDPGEMLNYEIILTGLRKTKKRCDDRCRSLLAHTSRLPEKHDSLMCIKNNHALGLLNGQIFIAQSDAVDMGGGVVSLHIKDSDTNEEKAITASEKPFLGLPLQRWEHEEDIEEFEYAYAITVHKAQGSQWSNVLLFDQKHAFPNWSEHDRRRWLYTGITRAAESVTVMRL